MPPKTRFSESDIREAALQLLREEGLKALTARHIADRAGSSTAPVYSTFGSMEDLKHAVMHQVVSLLHEFTKRSYTPAQFLNMGVGIAIFAREEPELFHALYLETNEFREEIDEFHARLTEEMLEDNRFADFTTEERHALLLRMAVITYGLATMICVGLAEDRSDEAIIGWLQRVGTIVIRDEISAILLARGKASPGEGRDGGS